MLLDEILNYVLSNPHSAFFFTPPIYKDNYSYLFKKPNKIITADTYDQVFASLNIIDDNIDLNNSGYGLISYEAGYAFEEKLNSIILNNNETLLKFCFFENSEITRLASAEIEFNFSENEKHKITSLHLTKSLNDFSKCIDKIKNHIAEGDTYQVNYTIKAKFNFFDNPVILFKNLVFNQSSQYCAFINNGNDIIISISPELFFSIKDGNIIVKPMKGTIKRGINYYDDLIKITQLKQSEKDKAENLMIVDLLRNDIGKLSVYGSVEVKNLFAVEKYESLFQMVSEINARLNDNIKFSDVLRNIFPCGSITGAPKIRTMQIIKDLEKDMRGIYTGAIGLIKKDEIIFNVAIRTITLNTLNGKGELGIGSGIVWDSSSEKEYEETILKSAFLTDPLNYFEIIETMKVEEGKIFLLDEHLRRLNESADYFMFLFDIDKIKASIQERIEHLDIEKKYMMRISLTKCGKIKSFISNFPVSHDEIKIIISSNRINTKNPFQYYKTTNRKLYNEEHNYFSARNYFDVIFFNENDELAEGAVSNIFIKRQNVWYTPPLSSGILAGIYRAYFIKNNDSVYEKVLYKNDLLNADEILLTNSVRGEVRVNKLFINENNSHCSFIK